MAIKRHIAANKQRQNATTKSPKRQRIPLKTPQQVRVFVSKMLRRAATGEVAVNDAYKLASVAAILLRTIEVTDIAERLTILEERT
jgi:hypothetical protein